MDRGGTGLHWLVDIARQAGLPHAHSLDVAAATPAGEAWSRVAAHCGGTVDSLAQEVAEHLRLPVARFDRRDAHVTRLVPEKLARRFQVVPLRESDRQIVVATAEPLNDELERGLAFASGRMPLFELASPAAIATELDRVFPPAAAPSAGTGASEDALALVQTSIQQDAAADDDHAPVVKLTNIILRNAVHERASDIHFEPAPGTGTVRFRVDGVMRVHMRMPLLALSRVVSRVKIMAALDIADRLRPQDGRASFTVDHQSVDLRISTVPTRDAEKCVIRLLRGATNDTLADLHLPDRDLHAIRHLIGHRNGVVIVTGPTGSGKTTTLYAAIRELNNGETNISTVEDPIEYELAGITQMQVETKRNFTFATALRAILRQDPDVILVGEIRDAETATIAVQASMTGHLVLTTLHTNDAASAIARLVDIGVERPAIAATLRGVVGQRLVRRVCPHCAEAVTEPNEDERRLAAVYGVTPVARAKGCLPCGNSGYLGRVAIHEVLTLTPALQSLIASGANAQEIQRAASQAGMRTLRAAALQRVSNGETTLQEVERVVGEVSEDAPPAGAPAPGPAPAPRAYASDRPAPAVVMPGIESGDAQLRPRPEGPRILVVDDDPVIRKVALRLLGQVGYEVIESDSGEDALAVLQIDDRIGMVVLDLGLPGMQGDEVLRVMRASPATAALPVVVLTGSPDPDLEVSLMEAGADDYIRKPIEPKRFAIRVKAALRRAAA